MNKPLPTVIYIKLLDEGTVVWRPVNATHLRADIYQVVQQPVPDEDWEFATGEFVRCREQMFDGGKRALAAYEKVET